MTALKQWTNGHDISPIPVSTVGTNDCALRRPHCAKLIVLTATAQ